MKREGAMGRGAAIVGLLVILGGCGSVYTLVGPGRRPIAGVYSVEPRIAWSAIQSGKFEAWTVDGFALDSLRFVNGIEDGEALSRGRDNRKRPAYRKGMTAIEIAELVVDDERSSGAQVEAENIRPHKFGTADGFRFELRMVSPRGLEGDALVVGAVVKDRLYVIEYSGFGHYYFAMHRPAVEQLIESVRLP